MKRLSALLLLLSVLLCACTSGGGLSESEVQPESESIPHSVEISKADEVRAVWISIYELPDTAKGEGDFTAECETMFKNISDSGLNTAFVHVRAFADAVYPSKIFPWSKYSCHGVSPEFDPLAIMVRSAHANGVKLHAWINPFRVSLSNDFDSLPSDSPAKKLMGTTAVCELSNGIYFNPASTSAHALIYDGVREILDGYEVDGIHIDDYFYPSRQESIDRTEYQQYVSDGGTKGLNEWRRDSVSAFAAGLFSLVKSYGNEKIFSISPAGNIDGNENLLFADVELWLGEYGYADYIVPQIYFGFNNEAMPFADITKRWAKLSNGINIVWGLAVYKCGKIDENARSGSEEWQKSSDILARQLDCVRTLDNYGGFALFSYSYIYEQENNENLKKEMQNLKSMI